MVTQGLDGAAVAIGAASDADLPAVCDRQVAVGGLLVWRQDSHQVTLDRGRIPLFCQTEQAGDPGAMGVHDDSLAAKPVAQNQVGDFTPTPGKRVSSSRESGIWLSWSRTRTAQEAWIALALLRNSPQERIKSSSSERSDSAKARGVG